MKQPGHEKLWEWAEKHREYKPGNVVGTIHPLDLRKLLSSDRLWVQPGKTDGPIVLSIQMRCMDCWIVWEESCDAKEIAGDWSNCPACLGIYDLSQLRFDGAGR